MRHRVNIVGLLQILLLSGCSAALQTSQNDDMYTIQQTISEPAYESARTLNTNEPVRSGYMGAGATALSTTVSSRSGMTASEKIASIEDEFYGQTSVTNKNNKSVNVATNTANVDLNFNTVLVDTYEEAYNRRIRGMASLSYRMPASYINAQYSDAYFYSTAYDPMFYNVMISGDEVWVEPKHITSMFGTWGATIVNPYMHYRPSLNVDIHFSYWYWDPIYGPWWRPWYPGWRPWYPGWRPYHPGWWPYHPAPYYGRPATNRHGGYSHIDRGTSYNYRGRGNAHSGNYRSSGSTYKRNNTETRSNNTYNRGNGSTTYRNNNSTRSSFNNSGNSSFRGNSGSYSGGGGSYSGGGNARGR